MVRRQLSALLRLAIAAPAGGENDRARLELVVAAARAPAVLRRLELAERRLRERRDAGALGRLPQCRRDRVAGSVPDLEESLARRAAAAREPVAAVLARELDTLLLEPVDRLRRLRRQDLDEPPVGGLVRALPDVFGVDLGRVVVGERSLDAALRLRGVRRLEGSLRRDRHPSAGGMGAHGRGEAGGSRADDEDVDCTRRRHRTSLPPTC